MEKVYRDLAKYFKKVSRDSGISINELFNTKPNDDPFDFKDSHDADL